MALTKVSGKVAYPYGKDGELESLDGTILYRRVAGGGQDGAVTVDGRKRARVIASVAEEVELGIGAWRIAVMPYDKRDAYELPDPVYIDGTREFIDLLELAEQTASPGGGGGGGDLSAYATRAYVDSHINSRTPHPAYDNTPDLKVLFENGLI